MSSLSCACPPLSPSSSPSSSSAKCLPDDVELVFCDLAGTTLDDEINGVPLVTVALQACFKHELHLDIQPEQVNNHRGKEKREMIQCILQEREKDISMEQILNLLQLPSTPTENKEEIFHRLTNYLFERFSLHLKHSLSLIPGEIDGVTALFRDLKKLNVLIGVGSGFPTEIVHELVSIVKWNTEQQLVSYVGSAAEAGKGRPDPAMLIDAMKKLHIKDCKKVVKIGDTVVDIEEGKNAGCWTVAVLTGTQPREKLEKLNPDFILDNITQLPSIFHPLRKLQTE